MDKPENRNRPLMALLIRLGAVTALSTMGALIKLTSDTGVHLVEILFWRQALSIPILLGWIWLTAKSLQVLATNRPGAHIKRGIVGLLGMFGNFGGVVLLPLAEATTMSFTAPIWAVLLSSFFLKDEVGIWRWSAVILGFVGILVIAQPGSGAIPLVGAAVALSGAFIVAVVSLQIADLNRTEHPQTIVFYFALVSAPICALGLPFVMQGLTMEQMLLLLAIGVIGTIGQLLLTASLRYGKVASVIVMDYSSLFWATLYGWFIFDVLPGAWTWVGAPLIVVAGLLITWREHVLARRELADQRQAAGT